MTPSEKIEAILKYLGINAKSFSEKLGYQRPQVIYDILKGKTKAISPDMADKIISVFPKIQKSWLLADGNEMLKEDSSFNLKTTEAHSVKNDNYRLVPLINIDSVGGMHSDNTIDPSEQYIIKMMPFTEAREGDVAIIQSGNSMYPTIPSGSALLIREVQGWQEYFGYGNIYVLWLKDGRRITKEVRRYDKDPKNYIWCVSFNPDVDDEELPRSMIRGVWKVIKYIADFGW